MFHITSVEKIKTDISFLVMFFQKPCRSRDCVEKCGGAREATNDHTILDKKGYMRACTCTYPCAWPPTHTCMRNLMRTHTEKYVILIALPWQQCFHKLASVLCYTHISFLVPNVFFINGPDHLMKEAETCVLTVYEIQNRIVS
jgi:hypothetical protein